jgi:hypothetical protein
MARNKRPLLSDETKMYLARIQGAGDRVRPGDYGLLTSREAGSFTKYAIMAAEQALAGQSPVVAPAVGATTPQGVPQQGATTPQVANQPGTVPFPTQRL